jgi:WG containing repeat
VEAANKLQGVFLFGIVCGREWVRPHSCGTSGDKAMKVVPLLSCLLILSACNQSPEKVAPAPATQASSKKLFSVTVGGKKGYIDRTGKLVVNPQYDSASDFSEGFALVCVGPCDQEHWQGFRYTNGEKLEQTFKYGYIDETGKMVINPMFESAESFTEGLAGVCVGRGCYFSLSSDKPKDEGKWGYVDKTGAMVIPPQFTYVGVFHEGLAAVSVGGKWGYIDKTGKFVVNFQFDSASEFDKGIAAVGLKFASTDSTPDKWQYGYIDRSGKYIWQPSN